MGRRSGLSTFTTLLACSRATASVASFVCLGQLQVKNTGKDVEPGVASGEVARGKQLVGLHRGHLGSYLAMVIDLPGGTCPQLPVGQVGTTGEGTHVGQSQVY